MANESAEILKLMKDNECDILDLKFTDLPGTWQHFSVPIGQVDDSLISKGVGVDGSSIRGFQSIDESDMLIVPYWRFRYSYAASSPGGDTANGPSIGIESYPLDRK